ncbi:MAG TPA: winged helix DNA-binding domain-containing protein [Methanomassiliicoccales archaeon]|jgi:hypothetical protein
MDPLEAVRSLGAVQAQDYTAAMWAIGLRTRNSSAKNVEKALLDRTIVRSPLLRNTIHIVPSENYRWMLNLFSGRMRKNLTSIVRSNHIELAQGTIEKGQEIIRNALQNGNELTRNELGDIMLEKGIKVKGLALLLLVQYAHIDGLICYGPRRGSRQSLALTDEWLPAFRDVGPDEAMDRITIQYFKGHGPATLQDYAWWTGLKISDALNGLERVKAELARLDIDKTTYWMAPHKGKGCRDLPKLWLLPNYDEYAVGYRDRRAMIRPDFRYQPDYARGSIELSNVIVVDGEIVGTWKRVFENRSLQVKVRTFIELNRYEQDLLAEETERYISFMNEP